MTQWIISNEPWIRAAFFVGVLVLLALAEWLKPRRALRLGRTPRWGPHLALSLLNTAAVRLLLPATAVGFALFVTDHHWGALNYYTLPAWLALLFGVLVLDLAIYLQHVMFHAVPALWRLHRVHHADLDFDVTTGVRFHPLEIVLSMLIKFGVIAALGVPALAVLIFEVLLNATSMFSHSNIRLPPALDRRLRWLLVTPDMHRVHHSVARHETNSNFGFNLPWWDRLFGSYRAQPKDGHEHMTIGLADWREAPQVAPLSAIILLPFRGGAGRYPINARSGQ
jgi:sterol desaturase/sphingolipid hydroxylase (fatty acid hydroxylase superfamily)